MILTFQNEEDRIFDRIMNVLSEEPQMETVSHAVSSVWNYERLSIYPDQRKVFREGQEIFLPSREFEILLFLAKEPNKVFTPGQIFENVWKEEGIGCENAVGCAIYQLRKKLEKDSRCPQFIQTVRGVGYKFVGNESKKFGTR